MENASDNQKRNPLVGRTAEEYEEAINKAADIIDRAADVYFPTGAKGRMVKSVVRKATPVVRVAAPTIAKAAPGMVDSAVPALEKAKDVAPEKMREAAELAKQGGKKVGKKAGQIGLSALTAARDNFMREVSSHRND